MADTWKPFRYIGFGTMKQSVTEFQSDDGQGMATQMAYSFLFALFPSLIFMAALAGFIGQAIGVADLFNDVMGYVNRFLPGEIRDVVATTLGEVLTTQSGGLLSFGAVGALWAAAGGVGAFMNAMNKAYDVEETRPFWKVKLVAVGLALGASVLLILALVMYIFGGQIGEWLANTVGLGEAFKQVWLVARWPLIGSIVLLILAAMYYFGPNLKQQFVFITPGSTIVLLVTVAATAAFSFYLSSFANFSATYGSIGAVMALMMWLYVISMIIMFGGEFNAVLAKAADPVAQEERARKLAPEEAVKRAKNGLPEPTPNAAATAVASVGTGDGRPPLVVQPVGPTRPKESLADGALPVFVTVVVVTAMAAFASIVRKLTGGGPRAVA